MTENMRKLLELASADEEVKRLEAATKEMLIALAKEKGIELTEADFTAEGELSEDELKAVAGGLTGECLCLVGGGGIENSPDKDTKTCACVGGGAGMMKNGEMRCMCPITGAGHNKEWQY